jgi:hypothetical protein
MKNIIVIITALMPVALTAQTAERQVIGSAGNFTALTDIQVSSTVGEVVVATASVAGTITLTQGFQQADGGNVGIDEPELGFSMNAYPNPTRNSVILDFTADRNLEVEIGLFDLQGKSFPLNETKLNISGNVKHSVDLSGMAAGNYFIKLTNGDGKLNRAIKIQKAD